MPDVKKYADGQASGKKLRVGCAKWLAASEAGSSGGALRRPGQEKSRLPKNYSDIGTAFCQLAAMLRNTGSETVSYLLQHRP